jgi:predicted HicB family RNase H-like nuclease
MSSTMTYKGQTARIEFDARDSIFVGRLVGISDLVSFHADTVADLSADFKEAVDDYLETCEKLGKPLQQPPP